MYNSELLNLMEIAERIYNIDPYAARDNGETPESIAEQILDDPAAVIAYLLDIIEG